MIEVVGCLSQFMMASPYALQETPSEQGISAGRSTHFHTAPNTATTAVSFIYVFCITVRSLGGHSSWEVEVIRVQ